MTIPDGANQKQPDGAIGGIRILDLTTLILGPYGTMKGTVGAGQIEVHLEEDR